MKIPNSSVKRYATPANRLRRHLPPTLASISVRTLAILGLTFCASANGANSTFEAYDFKRCQRWSISDDADDGSRAYGEALRLARAQPNMPSEIKDYGTVEFEKIPLVLSASTFKDKEQKIFVVKFGVCTYKTSEKSAKFSCLPAQDFPLSGATYIETKRASSLLRLKCSSGCNGGKPPMIVSTAIDEGESKQSRELDKLEKDFERRCNKVW